MKLIVSIVCFLASIVCVFGAPRSLPFHVHRHHDDVRASQVVRINDPQGQAILQKFPLMPKLENLFEKKLQKK